MGEKIRDLYPIHIGKAELMIELNEGYSNEGRVIHVQNSKFRYLFKQRDFLNLTAHFLRAKSELDYIRNDKKRLRSCPADVEVLCGTEKSKKTVKEFCGLLASADVRYRLIEDGEKFASFIIFPDDYKKFKACMANAAQTKRLQHPYGELFGYTFLYQMKPFSLYMFRDFYVEVMCQLPCMSLTPKTWIPLDRKIQSLVWDEKTVENGCNRLGGISLFIFKLCWAVFKDGFFSRECAEMVGSLFRSVDENKLKDMLALVFFNFTDTLYGMLADGSFDEIIETYFTYTNY